jgi:hypothetical protein
VDLAYDSGRRQTHLGKKCVTLANDCFNNVACVTSPALVVQIMAGSTELPIAMPALGPICSCASLATAFSRAANHVLVTCDAKARIRSHILKPVGKVQVTIIEYRHVLQSSGTIIIIIIKMFSRRWSRQIAITWFPLVPVQLRSWSSWRVQQNVQLRSWSSWRVQYLASVGPPWLLTPLRHELPPVALQVQENKHHISHYTIQEGSSSSKQTPH